MSPRSYRTAPPRAAEGSKIRVSRPAGSWYARIVDASASAERHIIDTASGVRLNLNDPRPVDIRIEDVAGGLSKVCRFGAQALEYYSVAQHALLVRKLVVEGGYPELELAALHHDSHEAYLCDIPKPLKRMISQATDAYDQTCDALDVAISEAFGFERPEQGSPEKRAIKDADKQALLMEAARLLVDHGEALRRDLGIGEEEFRNLAPLEDPLPPEKAKERFLEVHAELTGEALRTS
jgi:uncharacterized protein